MEIAVRPEMHIYAGALGVLAGDTAGSCADLNRPVVFVSLISRAGYLRQELDAEGNQIDRPDPWEPRDWTVPLDVMVAVHIEGRTVWVRPWLYELAGPAGGAAPVILLGTNLEKNAPQLRDTRRSRRSRTGPTALWSSSAGAEVDDRTEIPEIATEGAPCALASRPKPC